MTGKSRLGGNDSGATGDRNRGIAGEAGGSLKADGRGCGSTGSSAHIVHTQEGGFHPVANSINVRVRTAGEFINRE